MRPMLIPRQRRRRISLSIHLADQLAKRHITVNVIAPGMFPSKMMVGTLEKQGEEKVH